MTARRSKLDWYKSLNGADLTDAEFRVLVLLVGYSNASMGNAYPSVERLAKGARMTKRGVRKILGRLVTKGAVAVTQEGGNQVFKGAATVYQILTPPQPAKGEPSFPLQDDKSDDETGVKGEQRYTKGEQPGPGRGNSRSPHQVIEQVINHHSDPTRSGAAAAERAPGPFTRINGFGIEFCSICGRSEVECQAEPNECEPNEFQDQKRLDGEEQAFVDLGVIEDKLDEELDLTDEERRTVDGMLQNGAHPNAVRNTVNKSRADAVAAYMRSAS